MSKFWILFLSCAGLVFGCTVNSPTINAEAANSRLDAILDAAVRDENGDVYRNAAIQISMPGYEYSGAAGIAREDTGELMTVDHQFAIASVGKPMTSVIIYQLWEEGAFGPAGLDTTLAELGVFPPEVIKELHKIDGISYGDQITIRHLLVQTSGLKDVLYDDENGLGEDYDLPLGSAPNSLNGVIILDENSGADALLDCVKNGVPAGCTVEDYYLGKTWKPWDYEAWQADPTDRMAGLINFYLSGMNESAIAPPGEQFHYADTNYMILGLVIEHVTGNSLHHELRARIFDPLGMDDTYLRHATDPAYEDYEHALADQWGMGEPMFSLGMNISMDWGGGGEVSTLADLTTFIRALGKGELFQDEATLTEMFKVPEVNTEGPYGSGILVQQTPDGFVIHHNGSNGTWAEYNSAYDLAFVGTIDDLDQSMKLQAVRGDVYDALVKSGLSTGDIRGTARGLRTMSILSGVGSPLPILILLPGLLFLLVTGIIWSVKAGRNHRDHDTARGAWLLGIITVLATFLFVVLYVVVVLNNPVQLMIGLTPTVRSLALIPYGLIVLVAVMLGFAFSLWRRAGIPSRSRVYYSLAVLVNAVTLWAMSVMGIF